MDKSKASSAIASPDNRGDNRPTLAQEEREEPAQPNCALVGSPLSGTTNQGGYAFAYESWKGNSQAGGCRRYGLRNEPGRLYTPALWKDDKEVFIDAGLAECRQGTECPWVYVVKHTLRVTDGRTALSYGVNQDEYRESPFAFKAHPNDSSAALATAKFPPLVTEVVGVIADADQRPLNIGLRISSYVSGSQPPYQLIYEIEAAPQSQTFFIARPRELTEGAFSLSWESAASPAFFANLREQGQAQAGGDARKQVVRFMAGDIEVASSELLTVTQGGRRIFATSAPAYRPKE